MPVFTKRISQKIKKAADSRRVGSILNRRVNQSVERAKNLMDDEIDADPISQKIDNDPKTIGYFGFKEGDAPVEQLKFAIERGTKTDRNPKKIGSNQFSIKREYKIKFPDSRDVYTESALNLPWISKTWVEGVEQGLSGVERFAFMPGRGRSEFGLQLKGVVPNQITPLRDPDYMNRLARKFNENLTRILRNK